MIYLIVIEDAGNNYSAFSPDVPGCIATGQSIEETVSQMITAMELHLQDEDIWPPAKGIKNYMDDDQFKKDPTDYILHVEIG